jgi:CubicO group peptidase (beta-lactamase class C family)
MARTMLALALLTGLARQPAAVFPDRTWNALATSESGWSENPLVEARKFSESIGSTAVFVVHRGQAVAQWGDVTRPINFRSGRKSLLNALIGIAIERGTISLRQSLAELSIDDTAPALEENEKRATVADLITSRSGVYHPAAYEVPGTRRPARHSHAPGTFFFYNNWDFNALGTIYERAAGRSIFESFEKEIARPLQMQDFRPAEHATSLKEEASIHPAYIFRMTARDLARFGWLYANHGRWQDRQIVSRNWVEASTRAHVPNARAQNAYGYLWWVNLGPDGKQPMFWAAGAGGQFVLVVPARQLVIVHLVDIPMLQEAIDSGKTVSWGQFFNLARLIAQAAPK